MLKTQCFPPQGVDLVVDGNDIWAPHHPPPSSALQRWFLREGTSCHEFQRPAQQVLAMLDSGGKGFTMVRPVGTGWN